MRPRRIAIGGLPYFGRMLAELLTHSGWEARYLESAGKRPNAWVATGAALVGADIVYLLGGQVERWSRPDWLARFARRPIVMHWLGSDVTYALAAAQHGRLSQRLVSQPIHWAEVEWTSDELRSLGIQPEVVPLTSTRLARESSPLPPVFTVLSYLPGARPDFYGRATVMSLARSLPEIRFLIAGSEGPASPPLPNVEFLGWVENMQPVYARTSVLLRIPEHDGLSFMVLEAMAAGRHVIWNHTLAGVLGAANEGEARAHLKRLLAQQRAGRLPLNSAGQLAVKNGYSPDRVRDEILNRFDRILVSESASSFC
jgi:hypothetical protein